MEKTRQEILAQMERSVKKLSKLENELRELTDAQVELELLNEINDLIYYLEVNIDIGIAVQR